MTRETEPMKIAVYGASGLTGGLAVAELYRRGLTPVLVGRDEQRLRAAATLAAAAATALPAGAADPAGSEEADIRVAGLDDSDALADALHGVDAVVNTAGPFTRWGEPVVRAAIAAGCHYVDTNGEPRYHARIFETFAAAATAARVSVVPGMADDGGPGDLIAGLTAARLVTVSELVVADLREPGVASRGTARSMVAVLAENPAGYGAVGGAAPDPTGSDPTGPGAQAGPGSGVPVTLTPPGGAGPVAVTAFPLPGAVTVPWHVDVAAVSTVVRADIAALFGTLTADYAEAVPERPDEAARAASRWLMLAEAVDADGRRARGWVTGRDAYGSTAVIAVEAARRLVAGGAPAGTLAPAQAFDPAGFLDVLAPHGVTWHVTGPED